MKRAHRFLILPLPILLLVPLCVLKWRADHPPVSKMDRAFRDALSKAEVVRIIGGGEVWQKGVHLRDDQSIVITGRKNFAALQEMLRMSDATWPSDGSFYSDIAVGVLNRADHTMPSFSYNRRPDGKGSYVIYRSHRGGEPARVTVPSRFGPRFEAFIAQLAQRAKAPGHHPEVVLD